MIWIRAQSTLPTVNALLGDRALLIARLICLCNCAFCPLAYFGPWQMDPDVMHLTFPLGRVWATSLVERRNAHGTEMST